MPKFIHIIDDDAQVRAATSFLLIGQGYATQVYSGGDEFLAATKLQPGCILLDLSLGANSGLDLLVELGRRGIALPVIMISGHGDLKAAVQAMKLGAVDFLEKPYRESDLIAAIERALDDAAVLHDRRQAHAAAAARLERLSPRERQILQGLLAGMPNKTIARRLELSPRTVEMHRANMMAALGLASVAEAIRLAIDAELTPLERRSEDIDGATPLPAPARARAPTLQHQTMAPLPAAVEVLEGTTDCAFLLDRDWRFTYLNANARTTIADGRDLIGKAIWEAFPLAVETKAWGLMHQAVTDREPARFSFYEPDLGKWFDVNVHPIASGLQVFFRDISGQRHARASLKMSGETLRLVLEAAGDGAWDWNIATGELAMSTRFLERLGYAPAALAPRFETVRELVHPDDWTKVQQRLREHLDGLTDTFACEYRVRACDGSWRWNFDRGRIVERDPTSGAATRMVGSACDVTERKKNEEMAQEAFDRIALAQRNVGAGIWDLDLQSWRVRFCSRSLAMHGLAPDGPPELSGDQWAACLPPEDAARTRRELARAIDSGDIFRIEYRTLAPDGRQRWVSGMGQVVRDGQDRPVRFVGLNFDITERKEAALELERVRSELLHVSRHSAMGAMGSMLAHELNQPLTAIANYVRGVRRVVSRPHDQEMVQEVLAAAENSAEYAGRILKRLREHASLSGAAPRPVRLSEMIREAIQISAGGSPTIAPLVEVDPKADWVVADRVEIEQVLLNLLRNAREATAASDSSGPITIDVRRSGAHSLVRVTDCGPGVEPELRTRLFTPFASGKPEGTGIGLSICRTIIDAHGGRIWAEDNEPHGACFCFTLRRVDD